MTSSNKSYKKIISKIGCSQNSLFNKVQDNDIFSGLNFFAKFPQLLVSHTSETADKNFHIMEMGGGADRVSHYNT